MTSPAVQPRLKAGVAEIAVVVVSVSLQLADHARTLRRGLSLYHPVDTPMLWAIAAVVAKAPDMLADGYPHEMA
jgi:hypothetical protein